MNSRFRFPLVALALSLPASGEAQSVQDFTLEPAPTPTPTSRAQGPVDTESGAVPVVPREIRTGQPTTVPTATPTPPPPSVPSSVPTSSAPTRPLSTPTPRRTVAAPVERPSPDTIEALVPAPVEREPASTAQPTGSASAPVEDQPSTSRSLPPQPAPSSGPADEGSRWPLFIGVLALLGLLAAGLVFWRKRRENKAAPVIERPVVAGRTPASPVPAGETITLRCEVVKLTRSAMYATVKYSLTLVNRTDAALNDVRVGVDLTSAHSGASMESQVATDAVALETRHVLPRISPRQNVRVEGEAKLPLAAAQIIRQGNLPLLVPLLRVRVDGAGEGALVKTYVVGRTAEHGGKVQPFRLDDGPRSYQSIGQRELA